MKNASIPVDTMATPVMAFETETAEPEPSNTRPVRRVNPKPEVVLEDCAARDSFPAGWTIADHQAWATPLSQELQTQAARIWHFFITAYPDFPHDSYVELSLSNDQEVASINNDWRGKNTPTNVLSFPTPPLPRLPDQPASLGTILLAYETICAEAATLHIPVLEHVSHLLIHGLLHLLGHDHIQEQERLIMEDWEIRAMADLGYSSPYA